MNERDPLFRARASAGLDQAPTAEAPELITTGATVLGGGAWKVISVTLPQLYVLVVSIVAARYLGPADFGRQSFIAFVELSLISLLAGGLPLALMRQVGETAGGGRHGAVRTLVRWALGLELVGALVGGAALVAVGLLGADPRAAWVLAGVVCGLGVLHTIPSALLIGLQRWRQATLAGIVTGGASTVATVTVLVLGGGITGMFAVEAVSSAVILGWTLLLARRALAAVAPTPAPAGELKRRTARLAGLASLTVILDLIVWKRSEFFFLEAFSTEEQIAFYSIAFAVVVAVVRLPGTVAGVLTPAFANLLGAGETERIPLGFARALRLLVLVALPLVAAVLALGPAAVGAVWGEEFQDVGPPLVIMTIASLLVPVADLSYALFVGLGRLRVPLIVDTGAAAVNVVLALVLIPRYGAVGAALANSGAQVAAAVPVVIYARRVLGGIPWSPATLLPALAISAAAGLAGWVGVRLVEGGLGVALGACATLLFFTIGALTVGVLPRDDARWLERAVGHRLGGTVGLVSRLVAR